MNDFERRLTRVEDDMWLVREEIHRRLDVLRAQVHRDVLEDVLKGVMVLAAAGTIAVVLLA